MRRFYYGSPTKWAGMATAATLRGAHERQLQAPNGVLLVQGDDRGELLLRLGSDEHVGIETFRSHLSCATLRCLQMHGSAPGGRRRGNVATLACQLIETIQALV